MNVGSFLTVPKEMRHFARAEGDTIYSGTRGRSFQGQLGEPCRGRAAFRFEEVRDKCQRLSRPTMCRVGVNIAITLKIRRLGILKAMAGSLRVGELAASRYPSIYPRSESSQSEAGELGG